MLNRRQVIQLGFSSASVAATIPDAIGATVSGEQIIDTNANLSQWPFRRLPLDQVDKLVNKYRSLGITQAWVSSFDGLLHRDITSVNERLAARAKMFDELIPVGVINLRLPDWANDLQRCCKHHHMPGIRLYPSYHNYGLDDPVMLELLHRAAENRCFVQIVVALEDVRTQHQRFRAEDVDLRPLPDALSRVEGVAVQLLNARIDADRLNDWKTLDRLYFDTARVDSTDGVPKLVEQVHAERVMLGTHAPFLIPEAALIRTYESGQLDDASLRAVLAGNANQLIAELAL
ncbi:MAG: amidohydrolase family protein [Rubripirellula sp.]